MTCFLGKKIKFTNGGTESSQYWIFLEAKLEITNYGFNLCFETWSRILSSNYENVQLVYENLLGEEVLIQC